MSNNSKLSVRNIIKKIHTRYENAGEVKLTQLQKYLSELEAKKDSWTEEDRDNLESATMEAILLQATLQGAFSAFDTVLLELGYLEKDVTLDKNAETIEPNTIDTGVVKYTVSDNSTN